MYADARRAEILAGLAAFSEESFAQLVGQAGAKQLVDTLFGHDVQAAAMRYTT